MERERRPELELRAESSLIARNLMTFHSILKQHGGNDEYKGTLEHNRPSAIPKVTMETANVIGYT